jgi:hypothetical protein
MCIISTQSISYAPDARNLFARVLLESQATLQIPAQPCLAADSIVKTISKMFLHRVVFMHQIDVYFTVLYQTH